MQCSRNYSKCMAWCDAHDHVSSQKVCKTKAYLSVGVVIDMDPSRYHIKVSHSLTEKEIDLTISNVTNKDIVPKFNNKKFLFTFDKTNKCVKFADC